MQNNQTVDSEMLDTFPIQNEDSKGVEGKWLLSNLSEPILVCLSSLGW